MISRDSFHDVNRTSSHSYLDNQCTSIFVLPAIHFVLSNDPSVQQLMRFPLLENSVPVEDIASVAH